MIKKVSYRLPFLAAAIYLLGAMVPLSVAQRTTEHRGFSIVMGLFCVCIGLAYKMKYEKYLIEAPASASNTKTSQ